MVEPLTLPFLPKITTEEKKDFCTDQDQFCGSSLPLLCFELSSTTENSECVAHASAQKCLTE